MKHAASARGRRGSAIVVSLLMAVGMVVLTVSVFRMASGSSRRLSGGVDDRRAAFLAEAGLEQSFEAIRRGGTGAIGSIGTPAALGEGVLWVDATDLGGGRTELVATALCGSGRRALKAVVRHDGGQGPLFRAALRSEEALTLEQDVLVDSFDSAAGSYAAQATNITNGITHAATNGDVSSNLGIVLDLDAMCLGDAAPGPSTTVSLAGGSYVSGATAPASTAFALPPIVVPSFPSAGDKTVGTGLSSSIAPGDYAYGTLEIGEDATLTITGPARLVVTSFSGGKDGTLVVDATNGPVEVFVTGSYDHQSGFQAEPVNGSPMALAFQIAAVQDVLFPADTAVRGAYYLPEGEIVFASGDECWGACVARRIGLVDGMKLHFDEDLLDHFQADLGPEAEGPDVLGWCETTVEPSTLLSDRRPPALALGLDVAALPGPGALWEGVP